MMFKLSDCLISRKSCEAKEHTLYRKTFSMNDFEKAKISVFSNGIYKLYINGLPVLKSGNLTEPENLIYCSADVSDFLLPGDNVLAVISYCEASNLLPPTCFGVILSADNNQILKSNNTFLTKKHSAFLQNSCYDSTSSDVEFEYPDFDDSNWELAIELKTDSVIEQNTIPTDEIPIKPKAIQKIGNGVTVDFGNTYNGCLYVEANSKNGDEVTLDFLSKNGRQTLKWILSNGFNTMCGLVPMEFHSVYISSKQGAMIDTESITLITQK